MKALLTSFDLFVIALAFVIMGLGLARRWALWREKKPAGIAGNWQGLMASVLAHRGILDRPAVGLGHLGAFWGVVIPLLVIILAQFDFIIPQAPAGLLSLIQDLAGAALLIGTVYLLVRRLGRDETEGPARTLLPIVLLLVIVISGYLAAGARMSILEVGGLPWSSPVGWFFSLVAPASPVFMQMMIRLHFLAVLLLIAAIPYTFMRHAVASPLNVFLPQAGSPGRADPAGPRKRGRRRTHRRGPVLEAAAGCRGLRGLRPLRRTLSGHHLRQTPLAAQGHPHHPGAGGNGPHPGATLRERGRAAAARK